MAEPSIKELFLAYKETIEANLALPLDEEGSLEKLRDLSDRQERLRQAIMAREPAFRKDGEIRELIRECRELQVEQQRKLTNRKETIVREWRQFRSKQQARRQYGVRPPQSQGYFVDRHN